MSSLRHTPSSRGSDPRLDAYLDAARDCILDVGWRRTTLTEVAKRAGVSRMTIYRAWPDMGSLLSDLMTREWVGIAAATSSAADDTATPQGIAEAALSTVRALRDNELFVRIVELDPDLMLPYLLDRRGRSQEALIEILAAEIGSGQSAGTIHGGDPMVMARALMLTGQGFVFSALTMTDDEVSLELLDGQFLHLVSSSLAPRS
jgi:AcrR family transcriptional regulator